MGLFVGGWRGKLRMGLEGARGGAGGVHVRRVLFFFCACGKESECGEREELFVLSERFGSLRT